MTPIDQVKPPAATPVTPRVQRKNRSARDSNRDQRPAQSEKDKARDQDKRLDKLV